MISFWIADEKRVLKVVLNLIQRRSHLVEDALDISHAEHCGHEALLVVVVDERLGLGMVGIQPLLDRLLGVVRPLIKIAAAGIALALHLGLVEGDVIGSAALVHNSADLSIVARHKGAAEGIGEKCRRAG